MRRPGCHIVTCLPSRIVTETILQHGIYWRLPRASCQYDTASAYSWRYLRHASVTTLKTSRESLTCFTFVAATTLMFAGIVTRVKRARADAITVSAAALMALATITPRWRYVYMSVLRRHDRHHCLIIIVIISLPLR